jgi:cytochrome b561
MSLRSNDRQWGSVARFFHWVIALAILGNGIFGLLLGPPSIKKLNIFALHKSIGLTVLTLALLRLAWRMFDRRPSEEPAPRWQQLSARTVHTLLYMLIFAIPLSGWFFNSAKGFPLQWFKLFNLPALTGKNEDLASIAIAVHEYLFWFLLLMLVAHVGAALKHHMFDNDNVLRRMLPFGRVRNDSTPPGESG